MNHMHIWLVCEKKVMMTKVKYVVLENEASAPWGQYMQGEASVAIGVLEKNNLIGYAVFTPWAASTEYMILNYIFIAAGWRERYVATGLIEYAEQKLRISGFRYILTRLMEQVDEGTEIYHLLLGLGFKPLQEQAVVLKYHIADLYDSATIGTVAKACKATNRIEQIHGRNEKKYISFRRKMLQKGVDLSLITFDCDLSYFYCGDTGEYIGCILIENKETEVIIKYLVVDDVKAGKYAVLFLICVAVQTLQQFEKKKELIVSLTDKHYFDLFCYFFPDYFKSMDLWDYIKVL